MKKGKLSKAASLLLSLMLVLTLIPAVDTDTAWAEGAAASTTTLYIADTPGGTSEVVTESKTDAEGHWAWDAITATLTLDGFNGGCIESTGALNIILKGANTITMPSTLNAGSGAYNTGGIKASAAIEISGDSDTERDSLTVTQTATSKGGDGDNYGIGIRAGGKLTVTDCDLTIDMNSACDALKTCSAHNYGIYAGSNAYITGTAKLDIDINGAYEARGVVGTLYAKTSGNIEITVKSARSTTPKSNIEGASAIVASGSGTIDIDAAEGYASHDYFEVFEDAGDITFKGMLCIGKDYMKKRPNTSGSNLSLNISDNKKIVSLYESGRELDTACGFLYKEITDGHKAYYLTNVDNNPIKIGKIRNRKDSEYTLQFGYNSSLGLKNVSLDLEGLEVDVPYEGKYLGGIVSGGTKPYTLSIDSEKHLPSGLELKHDGGYAYYISGTPTTPCKAGSFNIIATDSSEPAQTASITVNYEEITAPAKDVTVGETTFKDNEDKSGSGWAWTASTKTLSLDAYNGGSIAYNSTQALNIVLKGTNTISMPETLTAAENYGIKADGAINISAAEGSTGAAQLNISQKVTNQTVRTDTSGYVKYGSVGICPASGKSLTLTDCTVKMNLNNTDILKYPESFSMKGIVGDVALEGTAALDIDIDICQGNDMCGVDGTLKANTSKDTNIRIYMKQRINSADAFCCVRTLEAVGTGNIKLEATLNSESSVHPYIAALNGNIKVGEAAGTISFSGAIKIKSANIENNAVDIAANKKIVQLNDEGAELTGKCGFAYKASTGEYEYFLLDESGEKITKGKIKTVDSNPLTFMDCSEFDLTGLKVGTYYTRKYFNGLVSGGTKPYSFSIEGTLPPGLKGVYAGSDSKGSYYIYGAPTDTCEAGSFTLKVSDSSDPVQTAEITVNYDAVTVDKAVTAVSLESDKITTVDGKKEIILEQGNTAAVKATVSPEDASISDVTWGSSDSDIAKVTAGTKSGNVTAATITAGNKAGKATVTVTTKQGSMTDTCDVYVRENMPNATVNYGKGQLEGLTAGSTYAVSGDGVTTTSFTTGAGEKTHALATDWYGKEISLIKTNATYEKCNSEAQSILLGAKPATPAAPTLIGTPTTNSITINAVAGNSYRCYKSSETPSTSWVKATATATTYKFSGLDSNTEYKIETRVDATSTAPVSEVSAALTVKTDKETVAAPTANRVSGTYTSAFTLKFTVESGAKVYYELGTSAAETDNPTDSSAVYNDEAGIKIGETAADGDVTVIKAIAYKTDDSKKPSSVVTYTYTCEKKKSVSISGNIVSKDTANNAVVKLYAGTETDADIRTDMRKSAPAKALGYTFTLGSETGEKQSFTLSADLTDGTYKLAVYKPKRDGKDPYVVSVVKLTVSGGTATIDGGSDVKLWLYGDVNDDGSVNAKDAGQASRCGVALSSLVKEAHETVYESHRFIAADVNGDGKVDAKDAGQISRRGVGLSSLLDNFDN